MAWGNHHLCTCLLNLSCLYPAVEDPFDLEGHGPGPASCTTAVVAVTVGFHVDKVWCAGPCDDPALLKIAVTKGFEGFSAIVTGIVIGSALRMEFWIDRDAIFLQVFQ